MKQSEPIIVDNLHKSYDTHSVIKGVSFKLKKEKFLGSLAQMALVKPQF